MWPLFYNTRWVIHFHVYDRLQGTVDDFSFFDGSSLFCFLLIEFHFTFSISYKIHHIMFINIVFWLGSDRPAGLFFSARFTCFRSHASLLTCFCYFALFHSCFMRECLGKHSCMSYTFPIAVLNGTCFFPQVHNVCSERKSRNTCGVNLNH